MSNNIKPHPLIPENAELAFDGVRVKIYQWDQKMYDGQIARFERIRFIDGTFVIPILKNGNILLTRQEQPARKPFISLPGGGVDIWESPLEWAKRELFEETRAISHNWKEWMSFHGTVNTATYIDYFIAKDCEITEKIPASDGGEKIELFEVTFDEFLELSSDVQFHHHWNILPILYEARLNKEKYNELHQIFYGK